ncbi:MAG TPA: hypothetical protein VEO54_29395 [Thermoanaerobaculia bacterium]|nr:hypothetical protein [Thermoanaerobaculia bacterium]
MTSFGRMLRECNQVGEHMPGVSSLLSLADVVPVDRVRAGEQVRRERRVRRAAAMLAAAGIGVSSRSRHRPSSRRV